MKKILLVGGGGHCKSILDSLLELNEYAEIAIIDKSENVGSEIYGVPIIGDDSDLEALFHKGYTYAFVSLGSMGNPKLRIKLFDMLINIGFTIPSIIDKTAIVSKMSEVEYGTFIGKGAVVNTNVNIKKGSIINTRAVVEHDCNVGEFVHIAPNSTVCGGVIIGDYSHIGANSVIRQQIVIGKNITVGVGSVVVKNICDNVVGFGCPFKEVEKVENIHNS